MKNFLFFLSFIFMMSVFSACEAEKHTPKRSDPETEVYQTAYDLLQSWDEQYPDYICGVWSSDGSSDRLIFGITRDEAGEAGKQEILARLIDDATASFVYQDYSYNTLRQMQMEIDSFFDKDVGLLGTGILVSKNKLEVGMDLEHVTEEMKQFMEQCSGRYGDAVVFVQGEAAYHVFQSSPGRGVPWVVCAFLVLLILWVVYTIAAKKALAIQTTDGVQTAAASAVSRGQIIKMAKNTMLSPSPELEKRIFDEIG